MTAPFTWIDGERTIRFGRGMAAGAVDVLGGPGYTLLTTARAAGAAPAVAEAAGAVHEVGPGYVDELAGDLLGSVSGDRLVALGGGRVVDVAKAVAAALNSAPAAGATAATPPASGPAVAAPVVRAMAVPTTLSGAEMTRSHRPARGVDPSTPPARCAVVVNDPALSASQPEAQLAASALNALGHAVEAPCTLRANPVATLVAHDAAARLIRALARPGDPDRDELALGALLAGYAIDSTGFGLHHVLSQTLVRVAGLGHGPANAAMLPHTIAALAWRFPDQHAALAAAMGEDPADTAARLSEHAGAARLAELGADHDVLAECADAAAARPQLDHTPPRAGRAEIMALYESAY